MLSQEEGHPRTPGEGLGPPGQGQTRPAQDGNPSKQAPEAQGPGGLEAWRGSGGRGVALGGEVWKARAPPRASAHSTPSEGPPLSLRCLPEGGAGQPGPRPSQRWL